MTDKTQPYPDAAQGKPWTAPMLKSDRPWRNGKHNDPGCPGLYLFVRGNSRTWLHRITRDGIEYPISIGPLKKIGLAKAREIVHAQRVEIDKGVHPKQAGKRPAANVVTFATDAENYFEHACREWTREHAAIWKSSLQRHVFPAIGQRPTAELTAAELAAIFYDSATKTGLWVEHTETAERVVDRVHAVLEHAIRTDDHGRFTGKANPATSVKARLPRGVKPSPQAHRSLNWRLAPQLYQALTAREDTAAMALRLLLLACAPRAAEIIELKWSEVGTGTDGLPALLIPGERMKGRKSERKGREIPLSASAIALLNSIRPVTLRNPDAYVFKGRVGGPTRQFRGCIGDEGLRQVLSYTEFGVQTDVHGLRTTFKDWGLDNLVHPLDSFAIERALAHKIGNTVQERYRRTDLIEHRRVLAERWSAHLEGREYVGADQAVAA